jgi:exodeoxyribonuclease VII large subunit
MTESALDNIVEWTVSELSAALRRTVEDAYGHVRVRGEISGFKGPHSSGHVYFALKDENARIEAVIWKGTYGRMRVKPEEGLEVIVTGRLTTYPGRSNYQIVIDTLEPAGIGALMKLLEERKKKLAAEGLFDEARKQLLPFLPEVIGVVTSPTGAVIRDILHRLEDRFPRRVLVWPVRVQGETSAAEVANAIRGFNALPEHGPLPRPDLIVVARGGGSLEDLWSFNEEIVVRAAASSMIPLISAVGHETDVTLIDFAADRRAPTPTAAAEMAVPVRAELMITLADLGARKLACWRRNIDRHRKELHLLTRALPALDELLAIPRQRLDACAGRLPRALRANAQIHHTHLTRAAAFVASYRPLQGTNGQFQWPGTTCLSDFLRSPRPAPAERRAIARGVFLSGRASPGVRTRPRRRRTPVALVGRHRRRDAARYRIYRWPRGRDCRRRACLAVREKQGARARQWRGPWGAGQLVRLIRVFQGFYSLSRTIMFGWKPESGNWRPFCLTAMIALRP